MLKQLLILNGDMKYSLSCVCPIYYDLVNVYCCFFRGRLKNVSRRTTRVQRSNYTRLNVSNSGSTFCNPQMIQNWLKSLIGVVTAYNVRFLNFARISVCDDDTFNSCHL